MKYRVPTIAAPCVFLLLSFVNAQSQSAEESEKKREDLLVASAPSPQKLIPLEDFPKDFRRSFLGLFSSENLVPLAIGVGATGSAAAFDQDSRGFFEAGTRFGIAEEVVGAKVGGGWMIGGAVAGLLATSQFKGDERFRAMSYSAAQGFLLNGLFTMSIKLAVGRERPDKSNSRSFPSGHASHSFAFATVMSHYYPRAKIPAYLTAGFVAASRLDKDVHFLSDVVAGAALGYIVGRTVVRQTDQKVRERKVLWVPVIAADCEGASVGVLVNF
jgi:membrane-associated phospholipid phosphatase